MSARRLVTLVAGGLTVAAACALGLVIAFVGRLDDGVDRRMDGRHRFHHDGGLVEVTLRTDARGQTEVIARDRWFEPDPAAVRGWRPVIK